MSKMSKILLTLIFVSLIIIGCKQHVTESPDWADQVLQCDAAEIEAQISDCTLHNRALVEHNPLLCDLIGDRSVKTHCKLSLGQPLE